MEIYQNSLITHGILGLFSFDKLVTRNVAMKENAVTEADLIFWIEKSLGNENFENYTITFTRETEKGDGNFGDIEFANVVGKTRENCKREVNMVIKHGKCNDHVRREIPVTAAFETEIHFYENVLPAFTALQTEHGIEHVFDAVPKYYKAFVTDNMEALVLENLKKSGYQLHDKTRPLNLAHQKKVLTEYGKLHALSFALKDQYPDKLNALSNSRDVMANLLGSDGTRVTFQKILDESIDILREKRDFILADNLRRVFVKSPSDMGLDLFAIEQGEAVILHGDCWNSNFMYKYENNDRSSPSKVKILDWQVSALR